MNEQELKDRAGQLIERALKDAPAGHRAVQVEQVAGYSPDIQRRLSDHKFTILAQGTDIVVFFGPHGEVRGWRDDGRKGIAVSVPPNRDALLKAVVEELELPKESWLGEVTPVLLPPVGWTHQAVIFLKKIPDDNDVLRAWVDPINLRIIQCLHGAVK